jgi:hypothetical protein
MKKTKKKKKVDEKRLIIKFLACTVYLIVIMILFVCSYKLFEQKSNMVPWSEVESVEQYSYIEISRMSEKFAYYEEENIGIHFVIEMDDTGEWRTYLIAIDEDNYAKYKDVIDFSYERTTEEPEPLKVYGYPSIISEELKEMALNNIDNFLPKENKIEITSENFEQYLTNSYLDTTQDKREYFNIILFATLILLMIMIFLLIFTILDKDKIVDNLDDVIDETVKSTKKKLDKLAKMVPEVKKPTKKEEPKKTKKKPTKKEEPKKTEPKKVESTKEEPKKVEPKKTETKKVEVKKEEPKKKEVKREVDLEDEEII